MKEVLIIEVETVAWAGGLFFLSESTEARSGESMEEETYRTFLFVPCVTELQVLNVAAAGHRCPFPSVSSSAPVLVDVSESHVSAVE